MTQKCIRVHHLQGLNPKIFWGQTPTLPWKKNRTLQNSYNNLHASLTRARHWARHYALSFWPLYICKYYYKPVVYCSKISIVVEFLKKKVVLIFFLCVFLVEVLEINLVVVNKWVESRLWKDLLLGSMLKCLMSLYHSLIGRTGRPSTTGGGGSGLDWGLFQITMHIDR